MFNKEKLLQAKHDFASFYLNVLQAANATYHQGYDGIKLSLQMLAQDMNQIKHAQAWNVANVSSSTQIAQLCSAFGDIEITLMEMFQGMHEQIIWTQAALDAAYITDDRQAQAHHLLHLGELSLRLTQYNQAEEYYEQAITLAQNIDEKRVTVKALKGLGDVYHGKGEFDRARLYYEECLSSADSAMMREMAAAYGGLGNVYASMNQLDECKSYYQKSLSFYKTIGDQLQIATVLSMLGEAFYTSGRYKEAEELQLESLQISETVGYKRGMSYALRSLSH